MAFSLSSFKTSSLSLSLVFILLFFLLNPPSSSPSLYPPPRRLLLVSSNTTTFTSTSTSCSSTRSHSNGLINYLSFHYCLFHQNSFLSIPFLSLFLLLHFYILIKTAQDHFSVVTTKLAFHLNLSPSMGAVTLLALGNGAPDVFASSAALRGGEYRTGLGAILSAGTFVSALVVGFVAIYAAPFSVDPAPFVRDVLFYLIAALFLFYVYLSAEIFLWQAIDLWVFICFLLVLCSTWIWEWEVVGRRGRMWGVLLEILRDKRSRYSRLRNQSFWKSRRRETQFSITSSSCNDFISMHTLVSSQRLLQ